MEITETLYVSDAHSWRKWLEHNYLSAKDIWLIYYNKSAGRKGVSYVDAVNEALCFGWIDSTIKKLEPQSSVQRFCPRRKNSELSELNKERIRILIENGKMTPAGLESIKNHIENYGDNSGVIKLKEFIMPEDILLEIKKDNETWENFKRFPDYYKRIRLAFIDGSRIRPDIFRKRLDYFLKMTRQDKKYGSMR